MKIRNLFISLVLIFGLVGCIDDSHESYYKDGMRITVIDSCEYITTIGKYEREFAHKGNCKFCEERKARREIEDLKTNPTK